MDIIDSISRKVYIPGLLLVMLLAIGFFRAYELDILAKKVKG
jgi:hypothetical protein